MSTHVSVERDVFKTVEVFDPNGHRSVLLEGLRASATVAEIRARAMSGLMLSAEHDWNVRHDDSGRLMLEEQRLGDVSNETHIKFTMQPDAGLG